MALPLPARGARLRSLLACVAIAGAAVALHQAALAQEPPHSAELDAAIVRAAKRHGVPEHLVRRIVMRESRYNPRARNHSFWGLMQISYPTARSMGFKGTPEQLLNPVTNLAYAVPYLANAFVIAGKREDEAVRLYASGYYATAKSRGFLNVLRTAESKPLNGVPDEPTEAAPPPTTVASADSGWSLFGSSTPAPAAPPQQLAYAATPDAAAAPIQAIAQAAPAAPAPVPGGPAQTADKNSDDGVAMVAGRDGALAPPKRWRRDGGTTVIARGEQRVEAVAAYRLGDRTRETTRHSRKTAVFAQLDAPGAAAAAAPQSTAAGSFQATAAAPSGQDSRQVAVNTAADPSAPAADGVDKAKGHRHHHRKVATDE